MSSRCLRFFDVWQDSGLIHFDKVPLIRRHILANINNWPDQRWNVLLCPCVAHVARPNNEKLTSDERVHSPSAQNKIKNEAIDAHIQPNWISYCEYTQVASAGATNERQSTLTEWDFQSKAPPMNEWNVWVSAVEYNFTLNIWCASKMVHASTTNLLIDANIHINSFV